MSANLRAYLFRVGVVTFLTLCTSPVRASVAYIANCCNHPSSVSVFETSTGRQTAVWKVGADAFDAVFAPNGTTAYVSSSLSHSITEFQVSTGATLATIPVGFNVQWMAITPDGSTLVAESDDTTSYHLISISTQANVVTHVASFTALGPLAISPDGTKLYVNGQTAPPQPEGLLVINPVTLVVTATVPVVGGVAVAVTPNGQFAYVPTLIVEPWTIAVAVVNTATNTVVTTIPLDSKNGELGVTDIQISPDGSTALVSEYSSHTNLAVPVVSVIQTSTNQVAGSITLPAEANPGAIVFSPSGKFAYVTGNNVVVDVVDVASMKTVSQMTALGNVSGLAISPDGKTLLCPNSGTTQAEALGLTSGTVQAAIPLGAMDPNTTSAALLDFGGAAASPDGARVYMTNDFSGNVSVIDTASKTTLASVPVCGRGVSFCLPVAIAVSPDGSTVYVANMYENSVVAIDSTTFATTQIPMPEPTSPAAVAVTPDGSRVYVAGNNVTPDFGNCSCYVFAIDTSTNQVVSSIRVPFPKALTVSPDGTKVYVVAGETSLYTISTATNTVTSTLGLTDGGPSSSEPVTAGIVVTPDGKTVFASNWQNATVWEVDVTQNQLLTAIPVASNAGSLALTPDATEVWVSAWQSGSVSVIDVQTGTVMTAIAVGNWSYGIAFAPR
jgi:YVTN family beta-propeller protein